MSNTQQGATEISGDVIDYPARDMTITVTAAMTIGRLNEVLKHENQQLPIDTFDDSLTIGDMVASDISGPRQYGYGTLRDYVIGIEASDRNGRVFHAGGRVVKNVAGYDLCRLLIGAEGQLGTLRQLTFKLKPLPAEQHLSVAAFPALNALTSALERLNLTSTSPQIFDVLNPSAAEKLLPAIDGGLIHAIMPAEAFLVLGFDGSRKACDWQTKTLAEELHGTAGCVTSVARPQAVAAYCRAVIRSFNCASTNPCWWAKVVILPSLVTSLIQVANDSGLMACGRAGNGIVFLGADHAIDTTMIRDRLTKTIGGGPGSFEIREQSQVWRHPVVTSPVERYAGLLRELLG